MALLEKVETRTLRGQIAARLREAILSGSLVEGERLIERKLAAQLGASVTAVREALIELETEGLVRKKPNAATHVTQLSRSDVDKIHSVRKALEAMAVEEAARRATPEQLDEMERVLINCLHAEEARDSKARLQLDREWHRLVLQGRRERVPAVSSGTRQTPW